MKARFAALALAAGVLAGSAIAGPPLAPSYPTAVTVNGTDYFVLYQQPTPGVFSTTWASINQLFASKSSAIINQVLGAGANGQLYIGNGGTKFSLGFISVSNGLSTTLGPGTIAIAGPFQGSFHNTSTGLAPQRPGTCNPGDNLYDIDAGIYELCHPNLGTLWGNALGQAIP